MTMRPAAPSKRTRWGCDACKARHKKCDESQPSCNNCQSRGIACPGFKRELRWQHQVLLPGSQNERGSSSEENVQIVHLQQQDAIDDDYMHSARPQWFETPSDSAAAVEQLPSPASSGHEWSAPDQKQSDEETTVQGSVTGPRRSMESNNRRGSRTSIPPPASLPVRLISSPGQQPLEPSILLSYYFDHVCTTVSTYDGPRNPFRTVIAARWPHSALILSTAQSLSAACLARQSPELRPLAQMAQRDAAIYLERAIREACSGEDDSAAAAADHDDKVMRQNELLIAVLLLGVSTSWHDPSDLGLSHYAAAVALVKRRLSRGARHGTRNSNSDDFFDQALTYWWMLLSFVAGSADRTLEPPPHLSWQPSNDTRRFASVAEPRSVGLPHPWAGISTEAQVLLARAAGLARTLQGSRAKMATDSSRGAGVSSSLDQFVWESAAREIEDGAFQLRTTARNDILDPQDPETDIGQYVSLNEAYKSTILILVYRSFPQLLRYDRSQRRARLETLLGPSASAHKSSGGWSDSDGDDSIEYRDVLFHLALHVLEIISRVPRYSRILGITPHLLVVAACELRVWPRLGDKSPSTVAVSEDELEQVCCQFRSSLASVASLRRFVMGFTQDLLCYFSFLHLDRMRDTIQETWELMDRGRDVLWLDVMASRGWATILG